MLALLMILVSSALAFDHSQWQSTLDEYRSQDAKVDYAAIAATGALDAYVTKLATASEPTQRAERMAFWLNAYNAITVQLVARNWPLASIRDLDEGQVWAKRRFTVASQELTLDEIEKGKLTPMGDPRIHIVLNCASAGCPPLSSTAFTASNLEAQLTQATRAWLPRSGAVIHRETNKITLHAIFDWYAKDFDATPGPAIPGVDARMQGALRFIASYLPETDASFVLAGGYSHGFQPFSWAVNTR